jgi:hypothetical protein
MKLVVSARPFDDTGSRFVLANEEEQHSRATCLEYIEQNSIDRRGRRANRGLPISRRITVLAGRRTSVCRHVPRVATSRMTDFRGFPRWSNH